MSWHRRNAETAPSKTAANHLRSTESCWPPVARRDARSRATASDRQGASHERGAALVEAPFAIVILLVFGMGAFWIGNVVTRYHELEDAVHAGSRYGSRAFAAPDTGARRRTAAQITAFTTSAAEPLTTVSVSVKCGTDPNALSACPNPEVMPPGTYLEVSASAPVATNDPVLALGRSINGLLSTIVPGSPRPFPQTITASESSVAVIE